MTIDYSLGYNSNKESNDFLRCFWAALRKEFGKAAWNLLPLRIENKIYLGHCDIGLGHVLDISLSYKIKGYLSAISISVDDSISDAQLQRRLKGCITHARKNKDNLESFSLTLQLDSAICFEKSEANYLSLDDNRLMLNVYGYDHREGTYRAEQRRCRRSYGYFRGLSILLSTRKYVTFNP